MKSNLTREDKIAISQAASDQQTGYHLIHPRTFIEVSVGYTIGKIMQVIEDGRETNSQCAEALEYFHACSEPKLMEEYEKKYQ